tara:strand:+ start:26 stop:337 length:312 start_codon:yes stop_codon:yes gene_type:complete
MKKMTYFIILSLVCTLAFSQAKPCCKNKGKEKVSCKLNKANIYPNDSKITVSDNAIEPNKNQTLGCSNKAEMNPSLGSDDNGCKKSPWWMFWAKKKTCCDPKA